jgi:hypothetical protein
MLLNGDSRFGLREENLHFFLKAAGVEPDTRLENTQVIESGNAWIGMIAMVSKSTVRLVYGHLPDSP